MSNLYLLPRVSPLSQIKWRLERVKYPKYNWLAEDMHNHSWPQEIKICRIEAKNHLENLHKDQLETPPKDQLEILNKEAKEKITI